MNKLTFFGVYSKIAEKHIFLIFVDSDLNLCKASQVRAFSPRARTSLHGSLWIFSWWSSIILWTYPFLTSIPSMCHWSPHAIWWTAGSNPYEVTKAIVQYKMLSGRCRTYQLMNRWSVKNQASSLHFFACQWVRPLSTYSFLHCLNYTRQHLLKKWKDIEDHGIQ